MPFNLAQIFGGWRRKEAKKAPRPADEISRRGRAPSATPPRSSTLGVESSKTPSVFPRGVVKNKSGIAWKLLIAPHISEKATMLGDDRYVFKVADNADKNSLKRAIESRYGVGVEFINIIAPRDKNRRRGQILGVKSGFKKAVVVLKAGDKITEF
ncbi:MAG: 50S ribosomal protein L23 [Candidatus Giovannonibacteria bacterium]|nr:MAG: 50S ribosomal protein L23 [Candidatus Giovannonibacteria bacterium]